MHTKTEIKALQAAAKRLEKCGGDCKHCEKCHIYTHPRLLCYAFGCDALPLDMFETISDSMQELHTNALETINFELSV